MPLRKFRLGKNWWPPAFYKIHPPFCLIKWVIRLSSKKGGWHHYMICFCGKILKNRHFITKNNCLFLRCQKNEFWNQSEYHFISLNQGELSFYLKKRTSLRGGRPPGPGQYYKGDATTMNPKKKETFRNPKRNSLTPGSYWTVPHSWRKLKIPTNLARCLGMFVFVQLNPIDITLLRVIHTLWHSTLTFYLTCILTFNPAFYLT